LIHAALLFSHTLLYRLGLSSILTAENYIGILVIYSLYSLMIFFTAWTFGKLEIQKGCPCEAALFIFLKGHTRTRNQGRKPTGLDVHGGFKVVFSTEQVAKELIIPVEGEPNKKSTVGTISYLPVIFGCTLASIVIRELTAGPVNGS